MTEITAPDLPLIERVEAVQDPAARVQAISTLSPDEFARLCALGYVSVESAASSAQHDAALAAQAHTAVQEQAHTALGRLGADPPGMAPCLAGIDSPDAAVKALAGKKPLEWAVEDGWLYVAGKSCAEVGQALAQTR